MMVMESHSAAFDFNSILGWRGRGRLRVTSQPPQNPRVPSTGYTLMWFRSGWGSLNNTIVNGIVAIPATYKEAKHDLTQHRHPHTPDPVCQGTHIHTNPTLSVKVLTSTQTQPCWSRYSHPHTPNSICQGTYIYTHPTLSIKVLTSTHTQPYLSRYSHLHTPNPAGQDTHIHTHPTLPVKVLTSTHTQLCLSRYSHPHTPNPAG